LYWEVQRVIKAVYKKYPFLQNWSLTNVFRETKGVSYRLVFLSETSQIAQVKINNVYIKNVFNDNLYDEITLSYPA